MERKRVGLRKLIAPYLKYDVEAAIAVFDDGRRWRLSYICDLREGSTATKRYSYVLGDPQGQYKTPLERLQRIDAAALTLDDLKRAFSVDALKRAFSVDALSDEFFKEYHRHYDSIVSEHKQQGHDGAVIHDYVKKMLGRIVFLHFLQKKGWLAGDPEFLKNLFFMQSLDRKADFLEQVLEPLFFGIFNTEVDNREALFRREGWDMQLLRQWQALPYLNGGLFERDEVDKQKIQLPAELFEKFFEFLASYNFTVDENDPDDAEVGVDPEMLGKIFESLLEDNKAKGAFYTPKEIVRYMCKESLIAYLQSRLDDASSASAATAIRHFVEQHELPEALLPHRETIAEALREVRICDPAIGSGAFPHGTAQRVVALPRSGGRRHNSLCTQTRDNRAQHLRRGHRAGAIDIARLRFWLSIVVDAEWDGNPASEPEPLPNFDYKFMQGNSLIESFEGCDLSHILDGKVGSRKKALASQYGLDFSSADTRHNLQLLLKKYFSLTDHNEKAQYRAQINSTVKSYILQQGITPTAETRLQSLDPSANQDFFLWHTWFKDIFDNGGFDIVIGNPPYFKYEGKNKNEISIIRNTPGLEIAFGGKLNAYKLFLAQSINKICKSKGIISLIFQNSFLADKQASLLRKEVIDKHQILTIDSFPERDSKKKRVFENLKMSVCILLMQKSVTGKHFIVNFWNDKYKSSGTNTSFSATEIKSIDNEDYCIPRVEKPGIPLVIKLRQIRKLPLKCYEGELNMTFHKCFFNNDPNNPTIIKGAAIQRYYATHHMSQGEIEYLDKKRFLSENNSEKAFHHELERLAMQGMTGANDKIRLVMTMVPKGVYLANSCNYIIPTEDLPAKYLLGLMNSRLMNWYFRCFSTNSNVNGYEVENFPMPDDNTDIRREITELVDSILHLKEHNTSVDTSKQERQIDKLVYQLYNLTPEEIVIIEQ